MKAFEKAFIFDLDNCLADDSWRIPYIDWSKDNPGERYAQYHAYCDRDPAPPATHLKEFLSRALFALECKIVFLTARPVEVAQQTRDWIRRNLIQDRAVGYVLIMRNNGDHRPSVQLKREMVASLPEYGVRLQDVAHAYDDREDIVAMYRELGIPATVLKIHDVCAYTPPAQTKFVEAQGFVGVPLAAPVVVGMREAAPVAALKETTAADVLQSMAETFRERNKVYGDNYKMVAKLMQVLFPRGVPPELVVQDHFHLFELALVKLSRYAISNLTHVDSAHDGAVYLAMCEAFNLNNAKDTTT